MAERSTAAVGVAETSGNDGEPLTARNGATDDGATDATDARSRGTAPAPASSGGSAQSPDGSAPPEAPSSRAPENAAADDDAEPAETTEPAETDDDARSADDGAENGEGGAAEADGVADEHGGAHTARPNAKRTAPGSGKAATQSPADAAESATPSTSEPESKPRAEPESGAEGKADAATAAEAESGADQDADAENASTPDADDASPSDSKAKSGSKTGAGKTREASAPAAGKAAPEAAAPEETKADETKAEETKADETKAEEAEPEVAEPPELHSGHKLARRYRLEECVTRLDGFSSWRAVDEKLRRAVGVHILPAGHPRARHVLAAARSAALLGDPRFVQVLDAVEEDTLVYVVHEWLPDATPLDGLLANGPLEPHEAYQLVSQLAQALAAAHREGLAHLRLTPACVLRTGMGQYRIRGLAVNAALRGVTSERAPREDTEAIGALLYAALTQRWPYEEDAHGLPGVGALAKGTLVAPDQVRAGVHRGLSTLAMRALVNDGATASRQEQPCATPDELAKAVAALPRIRPPEHSFTAPPAYQRPASPQGPGSGPAARPAPGAEPPAPPTLPGKTGKALKWGVSALLIAALGLGSWQVADALLEGDPPPPEKPAPTQAHAPAKSTGKPIKIVKAKDFDPESGDGREKPDRVGDAIDGNPNTYWLTDKYFGHPDFGNLKSGVGLILDLGEVQQVSRMKVDFMGKTSAGFLAAPSDVTSMPSSLNSFSKVTSGSGEHLNLKAKKPIKTRFVLLWLTKLPLSDDGNYRGRVTQVQVVG